MAPAETAEVVYAATKGTNLKVVAVVDSDPEKQGKSFNGLAIRVPDSLKDVHADAVVITSFARQEEIHRHIQEMAGQKIKIKKLSDL